MANKGQLRKQRENLVINGLSARQDKSMMKAVVATVEELTNRFPNLEFGFEKQIRLKDVVEKLNRTFPGVDFSYRFETSTMRPDGGMVYVTRKNDGEKLPILISERKNQGTNDLRISEGQSMQSKGNAIERLGKNLIGLRAYMLDETIFPFVCFGDGCDFAEDSSIIDRVVTMAIFGKLNQEYVHWQQPFFNRGTFYFQVEQWQEDDMREKMLSIAEKSILYYASKYGVDQIPIR
jgi:type II restriction enzyme